MKQFMASLPLPFQNLGQPSDLKVPSLSQFPFFNSSDLKLTGLDLSSLPEGLPHGFIPPGAIKQEIPDPDDPQGQNLSANQEQNDINDSYNTSGDINDSFNDNEGEMDHSDLDDTGNTDYSHDTNKSRDLGDSEMDDSRDMGDSRDMDSSGDRGNLSESEDG